MLAQSGCWRARCGLKGFVELLYAGFEYHPGDFGSREEANGILFGKFGALRGERLRG